MQEALKPHKIYRWISIIILLSGFVVISSCSSQLNYQTDPNIDYKKAALLNVELGRYYLSNGYTERAKKKFLHALKLMPTLPEVHSGMGYFWESVGEYQEAEKYYKKSIYLGKGGGYFYNQYAQFLCSREKYTKADQYFNLAVHDKLYTQTADAYTNAGICSVKSKDHNKAREYFAKALYHDPQKVELFLELASLSLEKKELALAKQHLEHFYEKNTKPTASYLWLKIKLAKLAEQEEQIANYGLLLKNLFPESLEYNMYQKEYGRG